MSSGQTPRERYGPAMCITEQTTADAYFEQLVERAMKFVRTRAAAEALERHNLGYYAGYYSHETRLRVERLFGCVHPVFGPATSGEPPAEEAPGAGTEHAR